MGRQGIVTRSANVGLATTYEGRDARLFERILSLVDYVEVPPDSIARATETGNALDPEILAELCNSAGSTKYLIHGVGLSISSAEGYSQSYLRLLDGMFNRLPIAWHSEHIGYTMVGGEHLGTMLPPPRTREVLDLLCERVLEMRRRYPVPFLLEHIVRVVPDCPGDYSEAEFLNALARESGCELIVDAYNLECDRENFGFDVDAFLRELDLSSVREIHLAGGVWHRGFRMDSHSRLTDDATRALANNILSRAPRVGAVTYEYLRQALPILGHDAICDELMTLRRETLCDDQFG